MFCPQCHAEYREGFNECADCHVALVAALPSLPKAEEPPIIEYEPLLETSNRADVTLIKSLLDSQKIPYFVQNEYMNAVYFAVTPCRVLVDRNRVDDAKAVLSGLTLNFYQLSVPKNRSSLFARLLRYLSGRDPDEPQSTGDDLKR